MATELTVKHLKSQAFGFPNREEAEEYFRHNSVLSAEKVVPWKATLVEIYEEDGLWGARWLWDFIEPEAK